MLIFLEALCAIAGLFGYVFGIAFLIWSTSNGAPWGQNTTSVAMLNIIFSCIPFLVGTLGLVGVVIIESHDKSRAEQTAGFQHLASYLHNQQLHTQAVEQLATAIRNQPGGMPR